MQRVSVLHVPRQTFEEAIVPRGDVMELMSQVKKDLPRMDARLDGVEVTELDDLLGSDFLPYFQQGVLFPSWARLCARFPGFHVVDARTPLRVHATASTIDVTKTFYLLDTNLEPVGAVHVYLEGSSVVSEYVIDYI